MQHINKSVIYSIILLGVVVLGTAGTTNSQQHAVPELVTASTLLLKPDWRISAENMATAASADKAVSSPRHSGLQTQQTQNKGKHLRLSLSFDPIIHKAADEFKIDAALIKAVIMAESRYNPKAISKRGARGLMQLMPATAKSLGVVDSFDPEDNIYGGSLYLKNLIDKFDGDLKLALAAYNAGSRQVKKYGGIPPFKQTRQYIRKVFKYHQMYRENA
jgi:soluble lytic murein transglycosylase-like protein